MFPSSGLFADIICPLSKRGLCERPHCLYRHATNSREMFGASCNVKTSLADFTGVQNGFPVANCGAPVNETKDDCLQELERINKEIETVRHEVEQEQRRLSRYQTVLVDASNTSPDFPLSKAEIAVKNVDGSSYGLLPGTNIAKTYSQVRKYVVDNSKPRTDLEYDPLSNFSAGFWASSSSGKEQKVKNGQCLKRARSAVPCDLKKPVTYQTKLSQPPSPDSFDDSNDDDVLIIEIPPSPDKKRGRVQKPFVSVTDKFVQDKVVELKEVKTVPVLPHSPVQEKRVYSNCSVVDLSGCSEDLERESQKSTQCKATEPVVEKSPEPASPPATTDQQDLNWNDLVEREENFFKVELTQREQPHSVEKMNPLQPDNFPPKNILVHKPTAANSPCRQHLKQAKATEPPAQNRAGNQWSCTKCVQSMLPRSQKASSNSTRQMQGVAPPKSYLKPAEPVSSFSQGQAQETSWTSVAESSSASAEQLLKKTDIYEVIISSDDEEEHNYSEIELSDSDPMEECYRIFMEANNEEKRSDEQSDVSVVAINVEKPEFNFKPQALPEKKRVAHEVKHTEQPVAKSRPQPQVLVPLRGPALSGFASQSSINSNIQRVQQRASMLTASVKGGQAFVSSTCQRRQEVQRESPAQIPENLQPAPVQNAYTNYIPLRTAVIDMGNNLHLILPEGTFPLSVSSCPSQVTTVLTPISQVQMSAVTVRPTCYSPAVTPVQRYRATAPVVIPVQARKPSLNSAFQSALSSPSSSPAPQTATVKPVPAKRKLKQQSEAAVKDKVPRDIRQRYVNMFTEEFLKTTTNVNDAFEKALAEERTVYNRSVNKLKYLSVAVNALKRLKNQSALSAKKEDVVNSHRFKGNIPLNLKSLKGNDMQLYESLKDYILTEERLIESNYPVKHPEKPGCAVLYDNKKSNTDPLKRICCRCGATYSVSPTGKHTRKEECTYHYGKGVKNKVPGGVETRYSCCEGVMGAPGCQVFKLHVHDSLSLEGFVSTASRHPSDTSCPGVYSLDCEMCYTVHGLELSRVTLVNSSLQVIYDTFVRPDNEVIDYNTRFSGICEEDVKENHTSLREVQDTLLSFISANTILIGHSLETDLCALKLLHGMVVDTSVVFPHRLGPPNKLTLNNLTAEYLRRIIQESVCGHDTAEDATACMELMLWKVKEDGKLKK